MDSQYFTSGFSYGFIFAEIAATPSKCRKCGKYPKIWHYNNAWQVECDCGRVSDMLITVAVSNWNGIYGDGSNYTTVLNMPKDDDGYYTYQLSNIVNDIRIENRKVLYTKYDHLLSLYIF